MRRSGLARHPAQTARRRSRELFWEEENATEVAYAGEGEWQGEAGEWRDAEEPSAGADDHSSFADQADEEARYRDEAGADLAEEQWDEAGDADDGSEERGLVAYHSGQTGAFIRESGVLNGLGMEPYRLGPGSLAPIFIAGERKTGKIGALGHTPIAPRAHRPRPFFFHTLALAIMVVSLVASALTVGALNSGPQFWNRIDSLAGDAAPPPPPVKFHWYTVRFADTVEGIASTFGVKVGGILELNGLVDGEQIYTGMNLKIPSDASYGANFQALLDLPYAPAITPSPPYGSYVAPPGFYSFGVSDYAGDPEGGSFGQCTWWAAHKRPDENFWGIGDAWSW